MKPDEVLDVRFLLCPLPIIKTKKKMDSMKAGQILEVVSTDEGIKVDMPAWCKSSGNEFLCVHHDRDVIRVYVRKST